MPDQFDINYNQQIIELLPPDKRHKNIVAYLTACMLSALQYLRDAVLGDYRLGSTVGLWTAGTYARGIKVNYKKGIYVSLEDNNTDIPTSSNWYLQQQFFIGLNERIAYNGTNLVLTYALNRWFATTFRQPGTGTSDIFLTVNIKPIAIFRSGTVEGISSAVYLDNSSEDVYNNDTIAATFYNFTINIPLAVYNSLDPIPSNRDAIIRSFADKYVYAGITYNIITY